MFAGTVTLNTDEVMVPVLVPRASPVAVSGLNSIWIIAGTLLLGWFVWGGRVSRPKPVQRNRRRR